MRSSPSSSPDDAAVAVAAAFVDAINGGDVQQLAGLMTDDHVFVDSMGMRMAGREPMRAAWKGYFSLFPDYRIEIERRFVRGEWVAFFGSTKATYSANGARVEMKAAWLARVDGQRVAEWRVYADNEPARAAMQAVPGRQDP